MNESIDQNKSLPLSRFTVLDLTRVRSGPTAVRQLADWGANVIKIEAPLAVDKASGMGGARHGPDFQNIHRNKRGLTLNLKESKGIEVFKKMVEQSDVVVENYRPDVKTRLGIDYASLKQINPRIVYASISGFGQDGPYEKRPGFDQIAQGMGGLMSITGLPGQGPVRVGIPIADLSAGLYAALGIMVALLEREVSGEGQWVQTSLLQAQVAMLDFQAARYLFDDSDVPGQAGNNHPTSIPTGVFPTKDGHINIAASGDQMWQRLCETLGADGMLENPAYTSGQLRSENRDALNAELAAATGRYSSDDCVNLLNKAGVPCGHINTIEQMWNDPQIEHHGMARSLQHATLGHQQVVNQPVSLSRAENTDWRGTPERGEHNVEVLRDFGFDENEIKALEASDVI